MERWTSEEEILLKEYSKKYLAKTIAKKLNRSYESVKKKAFKLGIELRYETDPWKKWKIDYLKDNINKQSIRQISKMIEISSYRIFQKCEELGIKYESDSWTDEEIKILKENAGRCCYEELYKLLPNRTPAAVTSKVNSLGLKVVLMHTQLDDKQINYLKDNWGKLSIAQLSKDLGITRGVIYRYKKELNLPDIGQKIKWTEEVLEKLREDAKTMTRTKLAKKYKTSPQQISCIAYKHNIKLIDTKKKWTIELDNKLFDLIDEGKNIKEITKELNLPESQIRSYLKRCDFDIKKISSKQTWTDEEVNKLKKLSKTKSLSELEKIFGKTKNQILSKAKTLNIDIINDYSNKWTDTDTQKLLELKDNYTSYQIATIMDKTEDTIKKRAKELNIKLKKSEYKKWTDEDIEELKMLAENFEVKQIAILMDRSVSSINSKLYDLGIKTKKSDYMWAQEDEDKLLELYKEHDVMELSRLLNRSEASILYKLKKLNLIANSKYYKKWSEEENLLLTELSDSFSVKEIAKKLNREEEAVRIHARKIGLKIGKEHRLWTEEEEKYLKDKWGEISIEYMCKKLNRTKSSLINKAYQLGLGNPIDNIDGLLISYICEQLKEQRTTITENWQLLGLKINTMKISKTRSYMYVKQEDLLEFLKAHQDIWDSRYLEIYGFGSEPEWLIKKRKEDSLYPERLKKLYLKKEQLLMQKQENPSLKLTKPKDE